MCFDCLVTGWLCELTVCCKCELPVGMLDEMTAVAGGG